MLFLHSDLPIHTDGHFRRCYPTTPPPPLFNSVTFTQRDVTERQQAHIKRAIVSPPIQYAVFVFSTPPLPEDLNKFAVTDSCVPTYNERTGFELQSSVYVFLSPNLV